MRVHSSARNNINTASNNGPRRSRQTWTQTWADVGAWVRGAANCGEAAGVAWGATKYHLLTVYRLPRTAYHTPRPCHAASPLSPSFSLSAHLTSSLLVMRRLMQSKPPTILIPPRPSPSGYHVMRGAPSPQSLPSLISTRAPHSARQSSGPGLSSSSASPPRRHARGRYGYLSRYKAVVFSFIFPSFLFPFLSTRP